MSHDVYDPISRRSLIKGTAAGIAGMGLALECHKLFKGAGSTTRAAASEYGPFKMGFQSYSLRYFTDIDSFIQQAVRLKLDNVELWRGHLRPGAKPAEIRTVKEKLSTAGIKIAAFGVESFTSDHAKNESLFKFGMSLGLENFSANPTKDAFGSLEKLAKAYDIKIAIHNHGLEDRVWQKPEWILASVKDLDPRIGACADLGHFIRANVDPVVALELLGSRVLGCHFKDYDTNGKDVVVGSGQLDVVGALRTLKRIGFNGPLSLEFEEDEDDPVPKMLECLSVIRDGIKKM